VTAYTTRRSALQGTPHMEGGYDDAEAVVLLIQNAVDQARRACRQRDWRGLRLEDLRQSTEKERTVRKKALLSDFPILRLGQSWINADGWGPVLTLSGTVRKTDFHPEYLRALPSALGLTDLRILVVVWQREGSGDVSISFYHSHLHPSVTARHLAVRGATANTDPMWTQGGKGKSFMAATHVLQLTLRHDSAGFTPVK
jgi:hypothetical protein